MPFYLYPSSIENRSSEKKTLVIFWTYEFGKEIKSNFLHELRHKIDNYLNHNFPFDKVLLLTHEQNKSQFIGVKHFFSEFGLAYSLKIENIEKDIVCAYFDQNGAVNIEHNLLDFNQIRHHIILTGLEKIFNRRGGIIGPSEHVHYVLPSGKHSNVFVRIGNILKKGVEINFIGFTLLPYLREHTTNIYCDTSSIAVAAQAAVNLKKIINEHFVSPNIESFSSYHGLNEYDFRDSSNSLFLISVSSNSGLANRIYNRIKNQTRDDYIVTLFRLPVQNADSKSKEKHSGRILCDLDEIALNIDKSKIFVYNLQGNNQKCLLCDNNSTSIEIIGDEFLTEKQETIPVTIREKYTPEWFGDVLDKLLKRKYISCHRMKKKGTTELRELYLDIDKLHKERHRTFNKDYNSLFEKYLNQKLPAALKLIIYLNDEASHTVAKQIKTFHNKILGSKGRFSLVGYKDDPNFSNTINKKISTGKGAILVVASSIAQSHSIIKISRDLREFHEMGYQVCYFVSAVRTESKREFDYIRSSLSFGKQFKAEINVFDSLLKLFVPDERHRSDTPWQIEIYKLGDYLFKSDSRNSLDAKDKKALTIFKKRFDDLRLSSEKGLVDNLFWDTPSGRKQMLTPGFVFLKFDHDPKAISQADVYFTIASVLHFLRTEYKEGNQIVLQQTEHQRRILDPENFSRFNDGVIQCSILRAAYDVELDYSHDRALSNRMKDILLSIVEKQESATYEFLLALTISKIKLTDSDKKIVSDRIFKIENPVIAIFHSMLNTTKSRKEAKGIRF